VVLTNGSTPIPPISNNRIPLPELAALMRVQKFGDRSRGKWDQMIGNDWKLYEIGGRRIEHHRTPRFRLRLLQAVGDQHEGPMQRWVIEAFHASFQRDRTPWVLRQIENESVVLTCSLDNRGNPLIFSQSQATQDLALLPTATQASRKETLLQHLAVLEHLKTIVPGTKKCVPHDNMM